MSAWPELLNAKSADVCDGVVAFALGGAITKTQEARRVGGGTGIGGPFVSVSLL